MKNSVWRVAICSAVSFSSVVAIGFGQIAPGIAVAETKSEVKAKPDAKTKEATFDDIKLELKKGEAFDRKKLTKKVEELDGSPIRIRGYMLPSFQQKGIKQFVLVRDNLECCFGPGAALHDCIMVEMQESQSTSFTVRPITVEGVFKVEEFNDPEGNTLAIYHMDGLKVK